MITLGEKMINQLNLELFVHVVFGSYILNILIISNKNAYIRKC